MGLAKRLNALLGTDPRKAPPPDQPGPPQPPPAPAPDRAPAPTQRTLFDDDDDRTEE